MGLAANPDRPHILLSGKIQVEAVIRVTLTPLMEWES